jgi:hypothetical protein
MTKSAMKIKSKLPKQAAATFLVLFLTMCLLLLPVAADNVPPVSFSRPKNFPVGFDASYVAVGDFNRDGKLDLVVCCSVFSFIHNKISILLGAGDGTFGPAKTFAVATHPASVAVGNFNEDGIQDLALANETHNSVSILLGNGDATFGPATDFAVGGYAGFVAVGDFNDDGALDLAVTSGVGGVSILLGDGTGSFGPAANFPVGDGPFSVVVGDFDEDGILDLAVANANSNNVSILLGVGDGTFGTATDIAVGASPTAVAIGDFNGDGAVDLAVTNFHQDRGMVSILLGLGDGTFTAARKFVVGSFPNSLAVGDFNGDGKLDLATTPVKGLSVLLGVGDGTFSAAKKFGRIGPLSLAAGDFNGDGKPDLAATIPLSKKISILLNTTP